MARAPIRRTPRAAAALLAFAVSLGVAACGDTPSPESAAPTTVTPPGSAAAPEPHATLRLSGAVDVETSLVRRKRWVYAEGIGIEFLLASADGRSGLTIAISSRPTPFAVALGGGSLEEGTVVVSLDGKPAFQLDPAVGSCSVEVTEASEASASGTVECKGLTGEAGSVDLARTDFTT